MTTNVEVCSLKKVENQLIDANTKKMKHFQNTYTVSHKSTCQHVLGNNFHNTYRQGRNSSCRPHQELFWTAVSDSFSPAEFKSSCTSAFENG